MEKQSQWIVDCAYTLRNDYFIHGGLATSMACSMYDREDRMAISMDREITGPAQAAHDQMGKKV
jgi:hypothetical protein